MSLSFLRKLSANFLRKRDLPCTENMVYCPLSNIRKVLPMPKKKKRLVCLSFAANAAEGGLWPSAGGSNTPPPAFS